MLEEFLGVIAFRQGVDRLAKPGIGARIPRADLRLLAVLAILVERMGRDAHFRDLVHGASADLQFYALPRRADDGGVDRAVIVLLWRRDIVLEAAGNDRPARMHDAERAIAIRRRLGNDTEAENIGELLEGERLRLHLPEDRIRLLAPSAHLGLHPLGLEERLEIRFDGADQAFLGARNMVELLDDRLIGLRIEVHEGELLQFLSHVMHAHASGERRIDVHRLLGNAGALGLGHVLERPHVVKTVGELDEQHPHIVGDRKQELAKVLRLFGALGDQIELLDLGETLDKASDILAEQLVDFLSGRGRILDRVMKESHRDGGLIHLHLGEDRGHFERMRDVGIAAGARLLAMLLHGIDIGLVEQGLVDVRLVFLHALDELVLTHHVLRTSGSVNEKCADG